jgi:CDP-diacylglycerol--serine O-phosphatidyltransferase
VTLVSALLMVSRIRFWSFKGTGAGGARADRVPFLLVALIPVVIAVLVIDLPRTLCVIAVLYALSGPVMWAMQRRGRRDAAT